MRRIFAAIGLAWLPFGACAVTVQEAAAPPRIDYIVLEGGGPDQGPGREPERNMAALREKLGPVDPAASRMVACGVQQLRILSRSTAVVAEDVRRALDAAERHGIPVWLHVDPLYAWGADTETRPEDAPAVKFWNDPEMREWAEFPGGPMPLAPRFWLNWGTWCSPAPAVPALGSPSFVAFARSQLAGGVLDVLVPRLATWKREGRLHLFAGLNLGWETHIPDYPRSWHDLAAKAGGRIVAGHPTAVRGLEMDPALPGRPLGYASLHWRGWDETKLVDAARKAGIPRDEQFRRLCYHVIHDYMEALALECHDRGLPSDRVYTHIVALATVGPAATDRPPVWTAVNRHSLPGFTMDNQGAARYDLNRLVREVASAPGSRGASFGAVETYFALGGRTYVTDADAYLKELDDLFSAGARVKVVYAAFPLDQGRAPEPALTALRKWLLEGRR